MKGYIAKKKLRVADIDSLEVSEYKGQFIIKFKKAVATAEMFGKMAAGDLEGFPSKFDIVIEENNGTKTVYANCSFMTGYKPYHTIAEDAEVISYNRSIKSIDRNRNRHGSRN